MEAYAFNPSTQESESTDLYDLKASLPYKESFLWFTRRTDFHPDPGSLLAMAGSQLNGSHLQSLLKTDSVVARLGPLSLPKLHCLLRGTKI